MSQPNDSVNYMYIFHIPQYSNTYFICIYCFNAFLISWEYFGKSMGTTWPKQLVICWTSLFDTINAIYCRNCIAIIQVHEKIQSSAIFYLTLSQTAASYPKFCRPQLCWAAAAARHAVTAKSAYKNSPPIYIQTALRHVRHRLTAARVHSWLNAGV